MHRSRLDGQIYPVQKSVDDQVVDVHFDVVENDPWINEKIDIADRVLLDVPCSGTGTWRREPDSRHRLTPSLLHEYVTKQRLIFDLAHKLVAPGGRLIYATCSILASENED